METDRLLRPLSPRTSPPIRSALDFSSWCPKCLNGRSFRRLGDCSAALVVVIGLVSAYTAQQRELYGFGCAFLCMSILTMVSACRRSALSIEINQLAHTVDDLESVNPSLERALGRWRKSVQVHQDTADRYRKVLTLMQTCVGTLHSDAGAIRALEEGLEGTLAGWQARDGSFNSTIVGLKSGLQQLQEYLLAVKANEQQVKGELLRLQSLEQRFASGASSMAGSLAQHDRDFDRETGELAHTQKELSSLQSQLQETIRQKEQGEERLRQLSAEVMKATQQLSTTREQIQKMERDAVQHLQAERAKIEAEVLQRVAEKWQAEHGKK